MHGTMLVSACIGALRTLPDLLEQLRVEARQPFASKAGGPTNNPNKSKSRPPINHAMLDFIDSVHEQIERFLIMHRETVVIVHNWTDPTVFGKLRAVVASEYLSDNDVRAIHSWATEAVLKARIMLGDEKPRVMLKDVSCHVCGGALSVAEDASTDVECVGIPHTDPQEMQEPCGNRYPRHEWLDILRDKEK